MNEKPKSTCEIFWYERLGSFFPCICCLLISLLTGFNGNFVLWSILQQFQSLHWADITHPPFPCSTPNEFLSSLQIQYFNWSYLVFPNRKWCHQLLFSEPEKNTKTFRRRQINRNLLASDTAYENRAPNYRSDEIKKGPFCKSEKEIKSMSFIYTLVIKWNFGWKGFSLGYVCLINSLILTAAREVQKKKGSH